MFDIFPVEQFALALSMYPKMIRRYIRADKLQSANTGEQRLHRGQK